ncbi:MmcQ/YjbR family DNA-binding protein [Phenylobacterium sp.]|uniref:MmcQ/YjbR family DNA-binding protein n=1 Tax=Phenylobacterium sp. TaxID=1871053 RepID=UPI0030F448A3
MMSTDPEGALARVRGLALGHPETDEVISHGIPAFRVAGKMFAYWRHDHHGDGRTVVCVKTRGRDEQEMLIEADPELFSRPAYLWPSGWVAMSVVGGDWDHVAGRLAASWRLAAPKRLLKV